MSAKGTTKVELLRRIDELEGRLAEAQQALRTLQTGEVERPTATAQGDARAFPRDETDVPYRLVIEQMNEGALTLTPDGTVLYCNRRFAQMLETPLESIEGGPIHRFVPHDWQARFSAFLAGAPSGCRGELEIRAQSGRLIPIHLSASVLRLERLEVVLMVVTDLSDLNRVEQALRWSERRYQALAEISPVGIFRADRDGQLTYVNERCGRLAGIPLQDILGAGWTKRVHPDDLLNVLPLWERYLREGTPQRHEFRLVAPDGTVTWVLVGVTDERDESGQIVGHIGTLTDITDRREVEEELRATYATLERRVHERTAELQAVNWQLEAVNKALQNEVEVRRVAQEALQESEALYRAIGESIPFGIWVCGPDGELQYLSDSYLKVVGKTAEEGRQEGHPLPHLDPAARRRLARSWRECLAQGRDMWRGEVRVRGVDGKVYTVVSCGVPVRDGRGRIRHWAGVNLDVTAEKEVEQALRESEERFRQLAENVNDAFWIRDIRQDRLVYVSPAFDRMWGRDYRSYENEPSRFLDFVHPDDRARVAAAQARQPEGGYSEEYRIVRPDGEIRWMWARAFPIRDDAGEVYRIAGITEDITERKRAEEGLRGQNEELERLVQQRTDQVRELERQRVVMEQLAAAGRMAARVAHEINNPLAGVKNAFLLLKDAIPKDHPYYGYVPRIQEEIDRIARVVRQMFDLCRPIDETEEKVAVERLVTEALLILEPTSRKRSVRVVSTVDEGCGERKLPGTTVRQILHNLLLNAIDASPPGAEVRLSTTLSPEDELVFAISDDGPGIPEERRPYVFEPFYTTKAAHQASGLGLGLSICKNHVERLGGRLTFDTESGRGTVFTAAIPLPVEVVGDSGIEDDVGATGR